MPTDRTNSPALDSSNRALEAFAWALLGLTSCLLYIRLYYGVDFTDEGFYAALPDAFSHGHRPLQDELAVQQSFALPLWPFVEAWLRLVGRDGLVLFIRHLYFAYAAFAALVVARYFGAWFGRATGLLLAAVVIAFVPYGIPSIGYNTQAMFGMLIGILMHAGAVRARRPKFALFAGSFFVFWVVVAYPTFGFVAAATVAASLLHLRHVRPDVDPVRSALACAAAALLWAVPVIALLVAFGDMAAFGKIAAHHDAIGKQGGGFEKLWLLVEQLAWIAWYALGLAALMVLVVEVFRRVRVSIAMPLMLLVGPAFLIASSLYVPQGPAHPTTQFALGAFALVGAVLLARGRIRVPADLRVELCGVVALSLLCSFTVAWSSANGVRGTGIASLPAALVALALLPLLRSSSGGADARDPVASRTASVASGALLLAALVTSFVGFELHGLYRFIYRDGPIATLDTRVSAGAYAGLMTTSDREAFIESLTADLGEHARGARTVAFFHYLPAGYLFTDRVPAAPSIWTFPKGLYGSPEVRALYKEIQGPRGLPELVVVLKAVRLAELTTMSTLKGGEPLVGLLREEGYAPTLNRPEYAFFERATAGRAPAR